VNFSGLSLDQAPPIKVPFLYFLSAPLFALIALSVLLIGGFDSFSQFSHTTIASLHLVTIGFFSFVMFGALTQMLPVIASATISHVTRIPFVAFVLMVFGLLSMVIGLVWYTPSSFTFSYIALGFGFITALLSLFHAIASIVHITPTIRFVFASLGVALFVVLLGVFLLYGFANEDINILHYMVMHIHSVYAVFGFAFLLIVGVSFQILPMFYVAPDFSRYMQQWYMPVFLVLLLVWGGVNLFPLDAELYVKIALVAMVLLYLYEFYRKLITRKRKINDATIRYFQTGIVSLFFGLFLWIWDYNAHTIMVASILIGIFLFSIMQGMLYKIVPFLVWFHLNAKGYMSIPVTTQIIEAKRVTMQYKLFVSGAVLLILGVFQAIFFYSAVAVLFASFVLLEYNLIEAFVLYKNTLKKQPDFDMQSFKG